MKLVYGLTFPPLLHHSIFHCHKNDIILYYDKYTDFLEENTMTDKQKKLNMWFFPLGTVGRDMVSQLFNSFLLTYIMFTKHLTTEQFSMITAIMIAARVFDAVNDPLMGNIIDRTRTRWGKFKPYLLIGILLTPVAVCGVFNTDLQGMEFVVFFGIIYFVYSIAFTMHDISYWGMIPSLGTSTNFRASITARASLFAGIGGTIASVSIPLFTTGSRTIMGDTSTAYGIISFIVCGLGILFLCFTLFGAKEDRSYEREKPTPVSIKKIISIIKGNDQLLWMILIFLLQQVGQNIILNGLGSMYIYFEFGYEGGLWSIFTTVGMGVTVFLMLFYPAIAKRINRKSFLRIMLLVSAVGYVVMFLAGALIPDSFTPGKFWIFTSGAALGNFGFYAYYLIMMISIINTVEYNEYKHGERNDAIIASVRPFVTKLGSAICVGIVSFSYIIFGVTEYTKKISSLEQMTGMGFITEAEKLSGIDKVISEVSEPQKLGMLVFITIVPLIFMAVSFVLYKKKYILDEEYYEKICREIEK